MSQLRSAGQLLEMELDFRNPTRDSYWTHLDGFRGILIIYVVLHHLYVNDHFNWPALLQLIAAKGHLAVPCFFALSGFLIFQQMRRRMGIPNSNRIFLLRRFFRIFPLWIFVLVGVAIYSKMPLVVFLGYLTFAFGWFLQLPIWFHFPQAWSLFIEEIFYVVMPLMFKWLLAPSKAIIFALFSTFIAYLWIALGERIGISASNDNIAHSVPANFHFFLWGIVVVHLRDSKLWTSAMSQFHANIKLKVIFELYFLCTCLLFLEWGNILSVYFGSVTLVAALVDGSMFQRVCQISILRQIGRCSYGIYLIHLFVLQKLAGTQILQFWNSHWFFSFLLIFGCSWVGAEILRVCVERPMIKLGRHFE